MGDCNAVEHKIKWRRNGKIHTSGSSAHNGDDDDSGSILVQDCKSRRTRGALDPNEERKTLLLVECWRASGQSCLDDTSGFTLYELTGSDHTLFLRFRRFAYTLILLL
nr:hypothetical protein CFP56_28647 [Quercus suber]